MSKPSREEMIECLIYDDLRTLDKDSLAEMLLHGWKGYGEMDQEELSSCYESI